MLASSNLSAPPSLIRARKASWGVFVLWYSHASVVLGQFTIRHAYALPPQVVADPPHQQIAKRHIEGSWTHLFGVAYTDFRKFFLQKLFGKARGVGR